MNKQGTFIATLLDTSGKALAAGSVLRVNESSAEAESMVTQLGFNEFVSDTEQRLRYLAQAMACGRPEILEIDIEWLAEAYFAREIPIALLKNTLICIREELLDSLPPGTGEMVGEYLDHAIAASEKEVVLPSSCLEANTPFNDLVRNILQAVLEGKRVQVERLVLDALDAGVPVTDLHVQVVSVVQKELGRMWQVGEINIAEEHFGSRIVEDLLMQLRTRMPRKPDNGASVLLASVVGNLHDIGPRLVADQLEMQGWRSIFLGANMPINDLVRGVEEYAPRFVALSAGQAIHLRSTAATITALRLKRPQLPILVGGTPFARIDGLWKDLGASGCATDAAEAVEFGRTVLAAGQA